MKATGVSRTMADLRPIREPVQFPDVEHNVARALRALMHSLRQTIEAKIRSKGGTLSFAHSMLLEVLAREPGISGGQAARRTRVTAQTMNGLLRSLEAAGCAVRESNPENRRADRWFLTYDGIGQLNQAKVLIDGVVDGMLSPLDAREVQRLQQLLQKCTSALMPEPASSRVSSKTGTARASSPAASRARRGAPAFGGVGRKPGRKRNLP
jgi:MarR family transcriptional regulator for hemolysin